MKKCKLTITEKIIAEYQLNEKHMEAMNELTEVINTTKDSETFDFYWDELEKKYGLNIFSYASFVHILASKKI